MPTVYIAHELMKKHPDTGELSVLYDTGKAEVFGARRVIFRHADMFRTPAELIGQARDALADATADDWLCFSGAPDLIVIAALAMAERTGGAVNLLLWDRGTDGNGSYEPRRIDLRTQE
jgi:hypothetical protein